MIKPKRILRPLKKKFTSPCCKTDVVVAGKTTLYYQCTKCLKPCDPVRK